MGLEDEDITNFETSIKSIQFCDDICPQLDPLISNYAEALDTDNKNREKEIQEECMKFGLQMKKAIEDGKVQMNDYFNLLSVNISKDAALIKVWKACGFQDAYNFCKDRYLTMVDEKKLLEQMMAE